MSASPTPETWDLARQEQDTAWVCADLVSKGAVAVGDEITLDLHFVAGRHDADRAGFIAAMREAGYAGSAYAGEDGSETIEATVIGLRFGVAEIWEHEGRTAQIALAHGFLPDGWGFAEP